MFQYGATNLVATVWQDRNPVRVLSTNSDPRIIVQANCQVGHQTVQVNQPTKFIIEQPVHEWC